MYRRIYGIKKGRTFELPRKGKTKKKRGRFRVLATAIIMYGSARRRARASERDRELMKKFWKDKKKEDIPLPKPRPADSESDEEPEPEVPEVDVQTRLHVTSIDLHIDENTLDHHTEKYECTEDRIRESDGSEQKAELVIRRGQEFKMTIEFDRPYDIEKNDITLNFSMGDDYKPNKGLNASFKIDEKKTKRSLKKWHASVVGQKGNCLTVSVFVPAKTPVGEWECSVRTKVDVAGNEKDLIWQYNHDQDINIIFNPWCKEDWVYMEDDRWRQEAVLNDNGAQYYGSFWALGARSWFFGQFEEGILDAAFHLLRKCFGFVACPGMGNAATVARMISQIVNSQDDCGVLMGNWSGDYEGGTSPCNWNGSVKIIRQYMDTGLPVKYGQCWVFSGVVTAVCRALGLPCRSVTNYASAHNTDCDRLSIDCINKRDYNGEWIVVKDDSVWNFHVWNEVWMARPDLCDDHKWDGWQVIDATPQEHSDGVFCCGPAPVKAIKEGELAVGKDGAFIFGEVNADKVTWQECVDTGEIKETYRAKNAVGKCISTHYPTGRAYRGRSMVERDVTEENKLERLDLTLDYKYEEGTPKEREVVKKAERQFRIINGTCIISEEEEEEEEEPEPLEKPTDKFKLTLEQPFDVYVGNPFECKVNVTNTSQETRAIKDISVQVFYKTYFDTYNGIAEKKLVKDIYLDGGKTETITVAVDDHVSCARPQDSFNFELKAVVSFFETKDVVSDDVIFRLRKPDVEIKGPGSCSLSSKIEVELSFTNPFKTELAECEVEIEGGLKSKEMKDGKFKIGTLGPKEKWRKAFEMIPLKHPRGQKDRAISVGFNSKQLADIIGFWSTEVN